MIAKTLFGLEDVLEKELRQLGAVKIEKGIRNVSFEGDKGFMYKANLCLRTAIKILKPIQRFKVKNEVAFYHHIYNISWEKFISPADSIAVDTILYSDYFKHSQYISLKTKDAIVDRFRDQTGKRVEVNLKSPNLRINIHIQREWCTVSLDSSGSSLHQRGYKLTTNIAPINEVLAAGMIMISGWYGQSDFLDPMCGSGTILIEAAMIACNIPANLHRKEFAFKKWKDFDRSLLDTILNSSLKKTREFTYKIIGYDKTISAVKKAIDNVNNANLLDYIHIEHKNFFESQKNNPTPLHMLFNPPYGKRLSVQDLSYFYKKIGDTLKREYLKTEAWLITSNIQALKFVGLKPSKKIKLFNGQLESKLVKYEIYEGSKKSKYKNPKM